MPTYPPAAADIAAIIQAGDRLADLLAAVGRSAWYPEEQEAIDDWRRASSRLAPLAQPDPTP
jgi:hypothetical protein